MTEFSSAQRHLFAKTGVAMRGGEFPVRDRTDLDHAIRLVGQAHDPDAAKAHIIKRARAIGAKGALPVSWL